MERGVARSSTYPLLPSSYIPPQYHFRTAVCRCYAHEIACHYAQCADVCIAEACGVPIPTLVQVTWHSTCVCFFSCGSSIGPSTSRMVTMVMITYLRDRQSLSSPTC
jgi:hypothetical protein